MQTLKTNERFDIGFDANGGIDIADGSASLISRLKFDIVSNADWVLRKDLGIDWINKNNDGFLQLKLAEAFFIAEISDKLKKYEDIIEFGVENYRFDYGNREAFMEFRIKTLAEEIKLEVNL